MSCTGGSKGSGNSETRETLSSFCPLMLILSITLLKDKPLQTLKQQTLLFLRIL